MLHFGNERTRTPISKHVSSFIRQIDIFYSQPEKNILTAKSHARKYSYYIIIIIIALFSIT